MRSLGYLDKVGEDGPKWAKKNRQLDRIVVIGNSERNGYLLDVDNAF